MKKLILLLAVALSFEAQVRSQPKSHMTKISIPLQTGWRFRERGKDTWNSATVPGCVHTDLLNDKLIADPFYRDNEKQLQWIGKTDWEYETTFQVTADILARKNIELVFEGLDTYANIFLNGQPLFDADNMFRTWRVECKSHLRPGANSLLVRFRSPINEILPVMAKLNYQLPAANDQGEKTAPFTRKAPYQFGWDWGPRFVTSGIWKPVRLEAWDDVRIADLHIVQHEVSAASANLAAEVEVVSNDNAEAKLVITNVKNRTIVAEQRVILKPGVTTTSLNFKVLRPMLWWPNGLGDHPLYEFKAALFLNNKPVDQTSTRTGLRSLELRQQTDEWGKSFTFIVNGVPVFAKGGNWIPADSFPTRITRDRYRHLLESVRDANMNMVRVWGGGIYESNDFYDLCDQMGILVWQDFMFACSMYPGDEKFLENVRHEAVDNIKRLRNHPAIVLWCGNNEIETGWEHWGWKQNLPASLWEDYKKIFHGVLPEACAALDPSRPYWPSSPSSNLEDDPDSMRNGDMHYWQVWHAAAPFSEYEKQSPRFMSEYGFQSFPQIDTVDSYTLPADRELQSAVMLAHQRHPRGNQLIREYMLREYPEPKDFESFFYVSQVLQAEGIKVAGEHLRRIMPRNMGSLYWQLDDCWPVASWSSIDYYGRWKALQFYARRFYQDLLVSPHVENGNIEVYIVSDRATAVPAELRVRLIDFDGAVLKNTSKSEIIEPGTSKAYFSAEMKTLLEGFDPKKILLSCELVVGTETVSTNEYFFDVYKNLALPIPRISTEVTPASKGFKITVTSDKVARAVYLTLPSSVSGGSFSDNYFNVLPGRPVSLEYHSASPISIQELRQRLVVRSLVDAF